MISNKTYMENHGVHFNEYFVLEKIPNTECFIDEIGENVQFRFIPTEDGRIILRVYKAFYAEMLTQISVLKEASHAIAQDHRCLIIGGI